MEHESSNTFTADDIHDPTDSTSMLKVILPNVSQMDGDLILVNADTKTDTYSPTTINYPDYKMLDDIGDLADSIVIIEANGKCHLDDDLASGTELDLDVAADKSKMTDSPLVSDILDTLNYFDVRGAINPSTGKRWYKITDNTGDDKKRSWCYINNNFKSQADVDAFSAKLVAKSIPIRNITFKAQDVGAHDMGTTIKYDFVNAVYNVPEGNYYVIAEGIDFDKNKNTIILSEGLIEDSKYAATYEKNVEYADTYASQIYDTDFITIDLTLRPGAGTAAWWYYGIKLPAREDNGLGYIYIDDSVDESRGMTLDLCFRNGSHGARTTDGWLQVYRYAIDGSADVVAVTGNEDFDAVFTADVGYYHKSRNFATVVAGELYQIWWVNKETDNASATEISLVSIQARYYKKRS